MIDIGLVLSGIRAVVRYRDRVDQILSVSEAATGLPFKLPPEPSAMFIRRFKQPAVDFFSTGEGELLLELHELTDAFRKFSKAFKDDDDLPEKEMVSCLRLYVEAAEIRPADLLEGTPKDGDLRRAASSGPSSDMRLAFYVVESSRLSKNPALARVILATADSLLEFVGENASHFVSSPKTRPLVESLLGEFAGKNDFDDESASDIFKMLLGATAVAALDHPGILPNKPALTALYGAINDVRKELADTKKGGSEQKAQEFLATMFSGDSLERVVNAYLGKIAKDPALVSGSAFVQESLKAVLGEIGGNFTTLFAEDDEARIRVLEAVIGVGADHVNSVLGVKVAGKPLTQAVLSSLLTTVRGQATSHVLVAALAKGETFGDLYAAALRAVAASASALQTQAKLSDFTTQLVTALAGELQKVPITGALSDATLEKLLSTGLRVLAAHPEAVVGDQQYAGKVLAAAIGALADAVKDGLSNEDVETVFDAIVRSAGANAGLAGFDAATAAALGSISAAIAGADLDELRKPAARKALLLEAVSAVSANPKVWSSADAQAVLGPLVAGLVAVAQAGRTSHLLSEPAMVEAIRLSLAAVGRRAKSLVDGGTTAVPALQEILRKAIAFAEAELGRAVAQENVPKLLERVVLEFLKAPFAVAGAPQSRIDEFFAEIRKWLDSL